MEAPDFAPLPDEPRPRLTVIEGGGELLDWCAGPDSYRVQVVRDPKTGDYSWKLNGEVKGLVDWDDSEEEGFIDGVDNVPAEFQTGRGAVNVQKASWKLIAICMHHINGDPRVIDTPVGLMEFDENHQVILH